MYLLECSSDTHKRLKALENKEVSYDCEVDPPFVGYVSCSSFADYIAKVRIMWFDVVFLHLFKVCKTMDGCGHW